MHPLLHGSIYNTFSRGRPKEGSHKTSLDFTKKNPKVGEPPLVGTHPDCTPLHRSIRNTFSRGRPKEDPHETSLYLRKMFKVGESFLRGGSPRLHPLSPWGLTQTAPPYTFSRGRPKGSHETSLDFRKNPKVGEPPLVGTHPDCTTFHIGQSTIPVQGDYQRRNPRDIFGVKKCSPNWGAISPWGLTCPARPCTR